MLLCNLLTLVSNIGFLKRVCSFNVETDTVNFSCNFSVPKTVVLNLGLTGPFQGFIYKNPPNFFVIL